MTALPLGSIAILSAAGALVLDHKLTEQAKRDQERRTYRLAFPAGVEPNQVGSYFNELHGILRPKPSMLASALRLNSFDQWLQSTPSIILEMRGTEAGYNWYLKVPYGYEPQVRARLESLVPGIQLTHEPSVPPQEWTHARELSLHYGHRPLNIGDPIHKSVAMRSAFGDITKGEVLTLQFIITPMQWTAKPEQGVATTMEWGLKAYVSGGKASRDEISGRRDKAAQPNFLTSIRMAALAETEVRASFMVNNVTSVFNSTAQEKVYFRDVPTPLPALRDRINKGVTPSRPKVQLTADELSALTGWPLGDMTTSGQPAPPSRRIPTPPSVSYEGIHIGESNYAGRERQVYLGFKEGLVHQHILGPPGRGKTGLLSYQFKQIVDAGYGAIVIEETGDLIKQALDYVPNGRIKDVIYFRAADNQFPVGWNVLRQGAGKKAVDGIVSMFESMHSDHPSMWAKRAMQNGLHTLAQADDATVVDLLALVSPTRAEADWAYATRAAARGLQQRRYWQEIENSGKEKAEARMEPLNNRFWPIESDNLFYILGQSKSTFTMEEVIRGNKILLVDLKGADKDAAKILGAFIFMTAWSQAQAHPMPDSPNYLIMDEAHRFMDVPIDLGAMLVEARKYGLGLMFAHQALYQLPTTMRQAIQQNTQTKIVFQTIADDARDMARVLGDPVTETDISHLGKFEAVARIATPDGGTSSPFTMKTIEPPKGYRNADKIIYRSRGEYGTPINKVEEEIAARRTGDRTAQPRHQRPKVSGS